MGRYYNGDIEGKFWFGVQDSNDADFFGVTGDTPNYLQYYFDENNEDDIKNGIEKCKKELGEYKEKLDTFFKDNSSYNGKVLSEYLKLPLPTEHEFESKEVTRLLEWYARLELGEKILKCVEENGSCEFEAEL